MGGGQAPARAVGSDPAGVRLEPRTRVRQRPLRDEAQLRLEPEHALDVAPLLRRHRRALQQRDRVVGAPVEDHPHAELQRPAHAQPGVALLRGLQLRQELREQRPVGRADPGRHERLEDQGAQVVRRRLGERAPQADDRRARRAAGERRPPGLQQRLGRRAVAAGRGRDEVRCELPRARAARPQQLGGARVRRRALARPQLGVERGAHERVGEAQVRRRVEDRDGAQRVGPGGGACLVELRQLGDKPAVGVVAEHEHRAGDCLRLGRQPREAHEHGPRDALRREPAHARRLPGDRGDRLVRERARQLAQQERVAAAGLVTGGRERLLGLPLELLGEERGGPLRAQRARREAARRGVGRDPRQAARGAGLVRPAGEREQQRQLLEAGHEEAECVERGRIRPVRVVDREQQRLPLGEPGEQPVEAVQDRESVGRVLRTGVVAVAVRREAERAARGTGRALEQLLARRRVERDQMRLEQLPHERERLLALEFRRARGEHLQPGRAPRLACRSQQARLAEAGRRLDHDEASATAERGGDRRVQLRQLAVALEQARHGTSGSSFGCPPSGERGPRRGHSCDMTRRVP